MPECTRCGLIGATVEFRRLQKRFAVMGHSGPLGQDLTKSGAEYLAIASGATLVEEQRWACKDTAGCARRARERA